MPLLRELIEIPEEVHRGDFVINLALAAGDAEATLRDYVVTEQLADAYDNALGFIAAAVRENASKAAYLDGSFGAGKSHFMAVLHLLLERNPEARSIAELAEAIARHDATLAERRFDLVPVHMIGADTLEQRIFESYLEHLRRTDPDAPPPAVFIDGPIFQQADRLLVAQGEERFFATLNTGSQAEEGWGALAAAWNDATYNAAMQAAPGDPTRARLAGDLIATHLPMFTEAFRGGTSGWVELDLGLAELTRHAQARGKDALVLFLDEVILWLGSRMADPAFVAKEGPKLVKLVEYSHGRQLPLISFLARQRDLREFIGDELPGAERLAFVDSLRYWNDRFHRIELADRNLPRIAQRRLLKPVSEQASADLDEAFVELERARPEVLKALLTDDADREAFRISYPFSPAFMKTLVAASSALQRERTALRVMLQLLVDQRDQLELGDLVSVGELFPVLSGSDEPFSEDLRRQFAVAKTLYAETLRPLLLAQHGVQENAAELLPRSHPFCGDDRLVGTLLLSALVSRAEPLRNLDVARLTALTHGSIATPIPGAERSIVLQKVRTLASAGAPIRIGEDPQNPSLALRLSGVDVETIIDRARSVDNLSVRRQTVRQLLAGEFGLAGDDRLLPAEHRVLWRGTWRELDVVFGNVRDESSLPDDAFRAPRSRWKVVIDYPFDEALHSTGEDLERLDRWRAEHDSTRTVCWLPVFLSSALQHQLGRLVVINHVLSGERLPQYADHLSRQDQEIARVQLEDHASVLRETLRGAIRQAYGVERGEEGTIEDALDPEQRLQSLQEGFRPRLPVGQTLRDAFEGLARQMLDYQYPDHPLFETEVKLRDLRVVWEEVQRAIETGPRIEMAAPDRRRLLLRIANPLELGTQHAGPFVLASTWKERLDQAIARARAQGGLETISVGDLRALLDEPRPRGLTAEVSALVLLTYARQTGRTFRLHGGAPGQLGVDRLADELELVAARLPTEEVWQTALWRAPGLLGLGDLSPARTAGAVQAFATEASEASSGYAPAAHGLPVALERRLRLLGLDPDAADRARSAAAGRSLIDAVGGAGDPVEVVEAVAAAAIPTSARAIGVSLATAGEVSRVLDDDRWRVIERLLTAPASAERDAAMQRLREAITRDEFSESLEPAVAASFQAGVELIASRPQPAPKPAPEPGAEPPLEPGAQPPPDGGGREAGLTIAQAREKLAELEASGNGYVIDLAWTPGEQ